MLKNMSLLFTFLFILSSCSPKNESSPVNSNNMNSSYENLITFEPINGGVDSSGVITLKNSSGVPIGLPLMALELEAGEVGRQEITIRNTERRSSAPLNISYTEETGYSIQNGCPSTLGRKQSCSLVVEIDATSLSDGNVASQIITINEIDYNFEYNIIASTQPTPEEQAVSLLEITPDLANLDFGNLDIDKEESAQVTIQIKNTSRETLPVSIDNSLLQDISYTTTCGASLSRRGACSIFLNLNASNKSPKSVAESLIVSGKNYGLLGALTQLSESEITQQELAKLEISPLNLDLGTLDNSEFKEGTISVTNISNVDANLEIDQSSLSDFSVSSTTCPSILKRKLTCNINIKIDGTVSPLGIKNENLIILGESHSLTAEIIEKVLNVEENVVDINLSSLPDDEGVKILDLDIINNISLKNETDYNKDILIDFQSPPEALSINNGCSDTLLRKRSCMIQFNYLSPYSLSHEIQVNGITYRLIKTGAPSVPCSLADAESNGWDISNALTASGDIIEGDSSSCSIATCSETYSSDSSSKACVTTNKTCYIPGGSGQQIYDENLGRYGECSDITCYTGRTLQGVVCVANDNDYDVIFESKSGSAYSYSQSQPYPGKEPFIIGNNAFYKLNKLHTEVSADPAKDEDTELTKIHGINSSYERIDFFPGYYEENVVQEASCYDYWSYQYYTASTWNECYQAVGYHYDFQFTPASNNDYVNPNNSELNVIGIYNDKLLIKAKLESNPLVAEYQLFDPSQEMILDPITKGSVSCSSIETNPCLISSVPSSYGTLSLQGVFGNKAIFKTLVDGQGYQLVMMDENYLFTQISDNPSYNGTSYGVGHVFILDTGIVLYDARKSSGTYETFYKLDLNQPLTGYQRKCDIEQTNPCDLNIRDIEVSSVELHDDQLHFIANYCDDDMVWNLAGSSSTSYKFLRIAALEADHTYPNYNLRVKGNSCSTNVSENTCIQNNCIWATQYSSSSCIKETSEFGGGVTSSTSTSQATNGFHCLNDIELTEGSEEVYNGCPNGMNSYTGQKDYRAYCKMNTTTYNVEKLVNVTTSLNNQFTAHSYKNNNNERILIQQTPVISGKLLNIGITAYLSNLLMTSNTNLNYYTLYNTSEPYDSVIDVCSGNVGSNPCVLNMNYYPDAYLDNSSINIVQNLDFGGGFLMAESSYTDVYNLHQIKDSSFTLSSSTSDTLLSSRINIYTAIPGLTLNDNYYFFAKGEGDSGYSLYKTSISGPTPPTGRDFNPIKVTTNPVFSNSSYVAGNMWTINNQIYIIIYTQEMGYELIKFNKY